MFDALNEILVESVAVLETERERERGAELSLPKHVHLTVARLVHFFERVWDRGVPEKLETVMLLSRRVRVGLGGPRWSLMWVQIGRTVVETWRGTAPLHQIMVQNQWLHRATDVHLAALLLALAWRSEQGRAFLSAPLWELQLLGRLDKATEETSPHAPPPTQDDRHSGHVRYTLSFTTDKMRSPRGESMRDWRGFIQRHLVRQAKRGHKTLKPIAMPRRFEDAEAKIQGLKASDAAIDAELRRLEAFYEVFERSTRNARTSLSRELIEETVTSLLLRLADCEDVWLDGRPVQVHRDALMPQMEALPATTGGLNLSWQPTVERFINLGAGFVVDVTGALRPLDGRFPPGMRALLSAPLPEIPATDVDRFVDRFALRAPVPLRLAEGAGASVHAPDRIEPRLMLSEENDRLLIEARFGYHKDGQVAEIKANAAAPMLALPALEGQARGLLLERQRMAEVEALELVAATVRSPLPTHLEAMDAYDFLIDKLPTLAERWTVYGEEGLEKYKVRGSLSPGISLESGIDWFDVDVRFKADDGTEVPKAEVLRSWLEGRRYHKLGDGSMARLPRRWLASHGESLGELEELRAAAGGKLGAFAASLAEGLLSEAADAAEEARGAEAVKRWRAMARALDDFEGVGDFETQANIQATLRNYQREGVRWLAFLRRMKLGGVLADDMGLGKTLQVLVLLADTHLAPADGLKRPSLVVAPASVVHNWALEAARFTPDLKVHVHHGKKGRLATLPQDADLIVTSYALLRLDQKLFQSVRLRYAVLDEAQKIKNPNSKVARSARSLEADHRLALTGTPLENNLYDLWSLFQFAMPGFFGRQAAFTRRYARPIHKEQDSDAMRALRKRTRPFILRRLKAEVASELPPRQEQVLYCDLSPAQRKLYDSIRETYRNGVMESVEAKGVGRSAIKIFEALTRLRQACCDPRLIPMDEARSVEGSAKLSLLYETLEELIEAGHRTLIFSQWPSLLKLARAEARERGWKWLYLDGSTRERAPLVQRWNDPEGPPIFFISLKAGGSGLNLTGADHVIHLDPWWNPAVEDQATDRAHRIGQTKPVVAYKLVARDTVEEKILELQARKRQLMDSALDVDRRLVETLTRKDLEAVFG